MIWAGDESAYEIDGEDVPEDAYYDSFYELASGFSKYLGQDYPIGDAVLDAVFTQDGTWQSAYSAFLLSMLPEDPEDDMGPAFSLYDLNGDAVPELFYSSGLYHAADVQVLTYSDGLRSLGNLGSYGEVTYFPTQKRLLSTYSGMGYTTGSYLSLGEDLGLREVLTFEDNEGAVDPQSDETPMYRLAGQQVSGEEYHAMLDGFVSGEAVGLGRGTFLTRTAALDPEAAAVGTPEEGSAAQAQLTEGFRKVLESFYYGCYLEGLDMEVVIDGNLSDNSFALYDVDGDGQEELIVLVTTTASAGMVGIVYGEDAQGEVYPELVTTPYIHVYDNGLITAEALHNHGRSESFWPYTLHTYDSRTDQYNDTASVSAWEKSFAPDGYPEEADTSGTGAVYYVDTAMDGTETEPMDEEAFAKWQRSLLGDADEIKLPMHSFTEEEIAALS